VNTLVRVLLPVIVMALVGWSNEPSTTLNATNHTNAKSGKTYYYDFDATTDSGSLFIGSCSSITWYFAPDADGATTGATIQLREIPSPDGSAGAPATFDCDAAPNTILAVERDGVPPITSSDEIVWDGTVGNRGSRNVKPSTPHICIDVVAASGHARVVLTCNP
jgi:hypothetical protein